MCGCECSVEWGQSLPTLREVRFMLSRFGRSGRRQADILLLCGKKVIFDRQVYTVSWQQADMPFIWAILPEYYPGGWCAHSVDVHPSIIRAALLADCPSKSDSVPQTGRLDLARGLKRSQAMWGAMAWHGGTEGRPASHRSTVPGCPSLHPDRIPLVLPSRAPCASPSQYHTDASRCQVVSAAT